MENNNIIIADRKIVTDIDSIKYVTANIADIEIKHLGREKGKNTYQAKYNGKAIALSNRFWTSLGSRFGVNQNIFNYFRPEELFERVIQFHGSAAVVRLAIEVDKWGNYSKILAVSAVDKQIVDYSTITDMIIKKGGKDITYNNGVVDATFVPSSGEQGFLINGDEFRHMYQASFAIDGYGDPNITLAMERLVCLNGMIAKTKAHTAKIKLGKDNVMHSIGRALDSYANEEGYDILTKQMERAQVTTASVAECNNVGKVLTSIGLKAGHGSILSKYQTMCGGLAEAYGEASLDAISVKFQESLPAKCTIYDVLNFVTELGSHHINENDFRARTKLHKLTGDLLSGVYDLEGLETAEEEFQDLFFTDKKDIKGFDDK